MDKVQSGVLQFNSSFRDEPYPAGFLEAYNLLECLAHGHGTETFLVSERQSGSLYVAKCYDRSVYAGSTRTNPLNLHHDGLPLRASFENTRNGYRPVVCGGYAAGSLRPGRTVFRRQVCRICIQLCVI